MGERFFSLRRWALATAMVIGIGVQAAYGATVTFYNPDSGLFKTEYQTADLIEAEFAFWRKEWEWLSLTPRTEKLSPQHTSDWLNPESGLSIQSEASEAGPGTLTWRISLRENATQGTDVYGAIVFRISLTTLREAGLTATPEIRPDKTGWTLNLGPSQAPLSVTFEKPVARLEFEPGNPEEIRAYLLERNDRADATDIRMTVSTPGKIGVSALERLANKTAEWRQLVLHWNRSPVDLSYLNDHDKPAGRRGFLRAEGEKFLFDDGTEARFWGTNLTSNAIFQTYPSELVRNQAKRLSQLGFNLVRIHHHDSAWVSPNIFDASTGGTRSLNRDALARLDWWIACLKAEGIYVWLDLHAGREVTAKDGVEGFAEIASGQPQGKITGFGYVNPSIQQRMKEFAGSYLSHVNQFTGTAYKHEPAVVALLVTNENDLSHHFGNSMLPDKGVPYHSERYMAYARDFASRTSLDPNEVWRSWQHGPSKLFLADLEHRLHAGMAAHLRELGVRAPIVGTNFWGQMSLASLPSLAAADFIDVHSYGRENEVQSNPRYKPNLISWIAAGAVAGKPLTVSEWNLEPFPAFDRFQTPQHLAAVASLQGWNGLMQYAYSQSAISGTAGPGNWEAFNDPALIAALPAAALLYRGRHVSEGRVTHYLRLPSDQFIGRNITPATSRAIRTLTETARFRIMVPRFPELDWLKPSAPSGEGKIIETADYDGIAAGANAACSDTKEICRDWDRGIVTVNTEKSQLALGWLGEQQIELADVSVGLSTSNASVAVQSLDDAPIAQSNRILISAAAQALPVRPNQLPFLSQPVEGHISIRARPGLRLYSVDPSGEKHPVKVNYLNGRYAIELSAALVTFWAVLEMP
jgi:hypothetical protein